MQPKYFSGPAAFRAWLETHHHRKVELLVGFHTRDSGRPSMTWPESVDQALCFGWIDGVRKRVDAERYTIRFTPRRPRSRWSAINIARVAELTRLGLMRAAGLAAAARRTEDRSRTYSYEQRVHATLSPGQRRMFRAQAAAWAFFTRQPPGYRRTMIFWVTSARQEATQIRRLRRLIHASAEERRL